MIAPARTAALRVLQQVDGGATLAEALVRERDRLPDPRDRALVTELASGVLRWRLRLDAAVAGASSRPLAEVDDIVKQILRLAAYQLLFLDRMPARAVVDDGVAQTKAARQGQASGFVNAVLRSIARTYPQGAWGHEAAPAHAPVVDASAAGISRLAVSSSHPPWLVERWVNRLGPEPAIEWMRFNNRPAAMTLRANRHRVTRDALRDALALEDVEVTPTRFAAEGFVVVRGQPMGGRAARAGLFTIQDEASQLVGEFAAGFGGRRVLDTCAAPGGKTLILAAAAHDALIVAGDRRPRRVRLLRDTLRRAGVEAALLQLDLQRGLPFADRFDLVLVDAPCSGLGTVRREPDIKWRRSEADLISLAAIQNRMIDQASRVVAPGGVLVYATCSSEPEENEDVVAAFLARRSDFTRAVPPDGLAPVVDADGCLRTDPVRHGLEAFFAAGLRRAKL